jgi:hypothetical protein
MKKENHHNQSSNSSGNLDKKLQGGDHRPIEDPAEYEALVNSLPSDQKEFVTLATRFAKLWEYLTENNTELPPDLAEAMRELPKLPHQQRIALLERINQVLMECEHAEGEGPKIRQ